MAQATHLVADPFDVVHRTARSLRAVMLGAGYKASGDMFPVLAIDLLSVLERNGVRVELAEPAPSLLDDRIPFAVEGPVEFAQPVSASEVREWQRAQARAELGLDGAL